MFFLYLPSESVTASYIEQYLEVFQSLSLCSNSNTVTEPPIHEYICSYAIADSLFTIARHTGFEQHLSELVVIPITSNCVSLIQKVALKPNGRGHLTLMPWHGCSKIIGVE